MSLSGILKSIILVAASVVIWGTQITLLQLLGYALALGGLVVYSVGRDELGKQFAAARDWATETWEEAQTSSRGKLVALPSGKSVAVGLLGLVTVVMCGSVWYFHTSSGDRVKGQLEASRDDILRLLDLS